MSPKKYFPNFFIIYGLYSPPLLRNKYFDQVPPAQVGPLKKVLVQNSLLTPAPACVAVYSLLNDPAVVVNDH